MDPLFLAGAVRVALDKLADSSGIVLRVAPGQVLVWQEMFRLSPEANAQPEILGDLSLPSGECVLETRLGTIEVGVRAQLEEIEKGFFDLLDQRPAPMAGMVKRAV
jgi:flagellar assembly protein FliH